MLVVVDASRTRFFCHLSSRPILNSIQQILLIHTMLLDKPSVEYQMPLSWPSLKFWVPFQYPIKRLIKTAREVLNPRHWWFKLSYRLEIWKTHQQHYCRGACQISEWSYCSKQKSCGFQDFARSYNKRSCRILKRVQGSVSQSLATNR